MDKTFDVTSFSGRIGQSQEGVAMPGRLTRNCAHKHLKARTSRKPRIKYWTTEDENMTLSHYSDSSAYMLSSSSPSSTSSVSDNSSTSLSASSSSPTPKKHQKASRRYKIRCGNKSSYKHIPHRLKPPHLVAKRNARERKRVQAVNTAFSRLRKHVPHEPMHRRLSKVKTLRFAIEYIQHLQELINNHDLQNSEPRQIQSVHPNFSHHYHQSHQHFIINQNRPDSFSEAYPCPAQISSERRIDVKHADSEQEISFFRGRNSATNTTSSSENLAPSQNPGSNFVVSFQHCSSHDPVPHTDAFSTIHRSRSSSYFRSNNAEDYIFSHDIPCASSLSGLPRTTQFENVSSRVTAPLTKLDNNSFEPPVSHVVPFRESFLFPDSPTASYVPFFQHFPETSFETIPHTSIASVDSRSSLDTRNTTTFSDEPYALGIPRPASSCVIPHVHTAEICANYTTQFGMFRVYSNRATTSIGDHQLAPLPRPRKDAGQDVNLTHSHFDHEQIPLNDHNVYRHLPQMISRAKHVNVAE